MPQVAPQFNLPDQTGQLHSLESYTGRYLVLYFYPGKETPDCTEQACAFRDEHAIISQFGNAEIVGINQDSVTQLASFAEKYHLNFPLLSDETGEIIKAYGAWEDQFYEGQVFSHVARKTFIIDPAGQIVKTFDNINPTGHAAEIIQTLQGLQTNG